MPVVSRRPRDPGPGPAVGNGAGTPHPETRLTRPDPGVAPQLADITIPPPLASALLVLG
jgi:hypothetical protein